MDKYKSWDDVPDHLATKTQLGKMGLRPAKGQKSAAVFHSRYFRNRYLLYDKNEAVPKRVMSEAQKAALEQARIKAMTTTCCNRYVGMINWREHGDMCASCYYAWLDQQHQMMLDRERDSAIEWARRVLADNRAVILDTETTGLDGRIVEIAIIKMDGKALLETVVNPECPIPPEATSIHGITDEMVQKMPTFRGVYEWISRYASAASRVVVYNADFDTGRLWSDCLRCELPALEFKSECAMIEYARYYGEWSDYHKSFRWQRLYSGSHRAMGDCLATLALIRRMAESKLSTEQNEVINDGH